MSDEGSYLGMPVHAGRWKKAIFAYLRDRVEQKIQLWQTRSLSRAGREVLIKTVLQAMPNYIMSLFLLLEMVCNDLEKMMNGFW